MIARSSYGFWRGVATRVGAALGVLLSVFAAAATASSEPRAKTPPPKPVIRVTDPSGKPINRINVTGWRCYEGKVNPTRESAVPDPKSPVRVVDGEDGLFEIRGGLIWAEGTGREMVWFGIPGLPLGAEDIPAEPRSVVLYPPSSITLKVVDAEGKPVAHVAVVHPDEMPLLRGNGYYGAPTTDATGHITFDRLVPGTYAYVLATGAFVQTPPLVIAVEPGEEYEKTIVFGPPREDTPEAVFAAWRAAFKAKGHERQLPPKPTEPEASFLAQRIADGIDGLSGTGRWDLKELWALTGIAEKLQLEEVTPALKRYLLRCVPPAGGWASRTPTPTTAVASSIAALSGDKEVDFLAEVARDSKRPYLTRRDAVIALGQVGSDRSVAAYEELRDAAYGKPGAPEPKESYTHYERMVEAVVMTSSLVPEAGDGDNILAGLDPNGNAHVSADYKTGTLGYDSRREGHVMITVHLVRRGDEWLVVRIAQSRVAW